MRYKYILLTIIFILNLSSISAAFLEYLPLGLEKNNKKEKLIIGPGVQEKQHQLNILKKEEENLQSTEKEFIDNIQSELHLVNNKIDDIKEKLRESKEINNEFLNKLLSKLNEIAQALIDIQVKRKQILNVIEEHVELLQGYIKDPLFKNKIIEPKSSFDFEALYKLQKDISNYEEEITSLNDEKINIEIFLETCKKDLSCLEKELKIKEKEQKRFGKSKDNGKQEKLSISQKGQLLDLDVQLIKIQKKLDDLKIKEEQQKLALVNTKIFINESIYKILKSNLTNVEHSLWVSEADVENANKILADKRRESTELQAKYSEEIRRISQEREKFKDEFEKLIKQNKINDLRALVDWSIDPKSVEFEPGLYELGYFNDRIFTFDRGIVLKESQRDYEKEKIQSEEILANIVNSWHKISQRKFKSEEEIDNEKRRYDLLKDELNKNLSQYKEKINVVNHIINNQGRIHNNILEKIKSLNERSDKFIENYGEDALRNSFTLLSKSEEQIKVQTDINNKIIENYSSVISEIKESLQNINYTLSKIENLSGILLRSKYAISWENIRNIIPDLRQFTHDVSNIISTRLSVASVKSFFDGLAESSKNFSWLMQLIIEIILLLILFFSLKKVLPYIQSLLLSMRTAMPGVYFINSFFAVMLGFISSNFLGIFIWSIIFLLIKVDIISDVGIKVIFYLASIFYLCYLAHKFAKYLLRFNKKHNHLLLNPTFQKRFIHVFLFFIYSTIIIFFFIEAFITISYGKSELPTILLAIYSIIFRACLIFLIGKDEILSIIPDRGPFWKWVRIFIDKYYYILLMGIVIIMAISDPYIGGFSRLVSFILWGVVYTILLVTGLWWFQILIRKLSSTIFFKIEEDEATKERFQYAKTFFGFFSILSFLLFILLAIFIGAKIWGIPVSLEKITDFSNVTIFSVRGEGEQFIPINLKSFLVLFSFLFFGFIIAWAFDRFILRRIFDILLVDRGVQNTVSSITYYFIVIIILLVGLLRIGLGGLIPFLVGALAVGLAFAIKGPANDFIGYFILLVERSIKIGDYVEIDPETKGVVRKITPRSVVIRKKNSVSVIVPNSRITNSSIYNWHYTPGFIAFDDILLTVPFSCDPKEVSAILLKAVTSNANVLKSPTPIIWLDDFSENGYVFRVRGFLSSINIQMQWDIASDVRMSIVKALREKGIQIASPVRRILPEDLPKLQEK